MSEWQPIETAPWQEVVLVKNEVMDKPVRATRGYTSKNGVHPDKTFFTTVFTPDKYSPVPAGQLVIATVWKTSDEPPQR